MNFTKTEDQLINLTVDYYNNKNLTMFADKNEAKKAINKKFFDVLGTPNPKLQDLESNKTKVFAIIQELANQTITNSGAEVRAFYEQFVDEETIPEGDTKQLEIPNDSYLTVGRISGNNWNLKRERIDKGAVYPIPVDTFYVGCYEYVKRVVTGRADFAEIMNKVAEAIQKHKDDFIANKFQKALEGLPVQYKHVGTLDAGKILNVISHVKASNRDTRVTILGTMEALGKLGDVKTIEYSDAMKNEMNNTGYLGKWRGYDCVALPTVYKANTTEFAFDVDTLFIVPSEQKLIHIVNEGEPLVKEATLRTDNMDMSQDYYVMWKMGAVVLFNRMMGYVKITS